MLLLLLRRLRLQTFCPALCEEPCLRELDLNQAVTFAVTACSALASHATG